MRIECRNFGPLREFSTDLDADFVMIVGENNIGKSYAISLMYAVMKTLTSGPLSNASSVEPAYYVDYLMKDLIQKIGQSQKDDFFRVFKNAEKDLDATQAVRGLLQNLSQAFFVEFLEKTLAGTFGELSNLENRKTSEDTIICVSAGGISVQVKVSNGRAVIHDLSVSEQVTFRKSKQTRQPKRDGDNVIIYGSFADADTALETLFYYSFRRYVSFVEAATEQIVDVHYLPASRSGLYQALSAFGQIIAELSKRRSFLSQRIELPGISEPLVDYFLKLNEIKPSKKILPGKFQDIAEELERNVLKGGVEFDQKSKRLFYKPFDVDLRLDLSSTSSMVSEVAPISAYLKHILPDRENRRVRRPRGREKQGRLKQLLFIEEPEAHLHPESQVLLMNVFARLVKEADIKIIMTSHSNFVFNKLSNLVMAGSFGESKVEAFKFEPQDLGTVSIHLDVDRFGITDENFSEVAENLFEEKIELIDRVNSEDGADHDSR